MKTTTEKSYRLAQATAEVIMGLPATTDWNPAEDWRCLEVLLARLTEPRTDPQDKTRGWCVVLAYRPLSGGWDAEFFGTQRREGDAGAQTLGEAVCEAALLAVRAPQRKERA